MLLFVDLLDEMSGIGFVGMPEIQGDFELRYTAAALIAFVIPGTAAFLLEPMLMVWADRNPRQRQRIVVGGLLTMGVGMALAAAAPIAALFAVGMALAWVGNGLGVSLAQATLMDADPDRRELWMGRWVVFGTLGDLAAPLVMAAVASVSLGWRTALALVAVPVIAHALLLSRVHFPAVAEVDEEEEEDEPPMWQALKQTLTDRHLVLWLLAAASCGLLDETFVAFGSAWLAQAFDASLAQRGVVFGLGTGGGLVGLAVMQWLLARGANPIRLLIGSSAASLAALMIWLAAPTLLASAVALVVLEATSVQLYPLVQAQAYRALPGHAALVGAAQSALSPLDWLAPLAIGLVADRFGLFAGLGVLALQPLWVLVVAVIAPRAPQPA